MKLNDDPGLPVRRSATMKFKPSVVPCRSERVLEAATAAKCRACPRRGVCTNGVWIERSQWCMTCGATGHSAVDCPRGKE